MHEFSEESFDIEKSYEYILSIQVSLNGFSFSVQRPSDKAFLFFKNNPFKISNSSLLIRRFKEWIESEELLQKPFQKVRIIVLSEKFGLIPSHMQHKDLNEDLAHLLFKNANALQLAENLVEKLDAKLLFAIPDGLNKAIHNSIGECEIIHPLKLIIHSVLETNEKQMVVLFFEEKRLQLLVVRYGKLLMANSFKINHANDVVYFVLTVLKQFEISSHKTKLFYTGKSDYSIDSITNMEKHFTSTENLSTDKIKMANELPKQILSENIALFI